MQKGGGVSDLLKSWFMIMENGKILVFRELRNREIQCVLNENINRFLEREKQHLQGSVK